MNWGAYPAPRRGWGCGVEVGRSLRFRSPVLDSPLRETCSEAATDWLPSRHLKQCTSAQEAILAPCLVMTCPLPWWRNVQSVPCRGRTPVKGMRGTLLVPRGKARALSNCSLRAEPQLWPGKPLLGCSCQWPEEPPLELVLFRPEKPFKDPVRVRSVAGERRSRQAYL